MAIWNMLSFNKWSTILKMKYILELYYKNFKILFIFVNAWIKVHNQLETTTLANMRLLNKKICVDCFACIVKWNKLWQGRSLFFPQIHSITYWNVTYKTFSFLISNYQSKIFNKVLFICRQTRLLGTTRSLDNLEYIWM